jgi:hypothetical protein
VLKIKNANSSKGEETKKCQQLVTPLHYLPCSGGLLPPQMPGYNRKNRLSIFSFIGKVRDVWLAR